MTRNLVGALAAGACFAMVGCSNLSSSDAPDFDRGAESVDVTIDFAEFSGDMTPQEFGDLLQSEDLQLALYTAPKFLWLGVNADFEWVFSGWLPIPRGWRVVPIEEAVVLDRSRYTIQDHRSLVIHVPRYPSSNRQSVRLEFKIPSPRRAVQWLRYVEPGSSQDTMSVKIDFVTGRPDTEGASAGDANATREVSMRSVFARENEVFGVAGTVTLSGARASVAEERLLDPDDRMSMDGKRVFTPSSPFIHYHIALAADELAQGGGLQQEILQLQRKISEGQCCGASAEQLHAWQETCRGAIERHMAAFKQRDDVAPFANPYQRASKELDGAPLSDARMAEAKVRGHHLQYIALSVARGEQRKRIHPLAGEYEIFYVDRQPYAYIARQPPLSTQETVVDVETRVRWDPEHRVSLYKVGPPRYDNGEDRAVASQPDRATIESIETNARKMLDAFEPTTQCQ